MDIARCWLADAASLTTIPIADVTTEFTLQVVEETDSFAHLHTYPDVLKPELQQPKTPAKHRIYY